MSINANTSDLSELEDAYKEGLIAKDEYESKKAER